MSMKGFDDETRYIISIKHFHTAKKDKNIKKIVNHKWSKLGKIL